MTLDDIVDVDADVVLCCFSIVSQNKREAIFADEQNMTFLLGSFSIVRVQSEPECQ